MSNGTTPSVVAAPTRLDLACGQNKQEGFFGIDVQPTDDTDLVLDLLRFPWPFDDDSVEEVYSSHWVEHIPHWRPWFGEIDGLLLVMDEIWRVCKDQAQVRIVHPYGMTARALQDPTHERYIVEQTWGYFNRQVREDMGLSHYPVTCDFEITNISNSFHGEWYGRADLARTWAQQHYWNVIGDLAVDLRVLKG